MTEPSAYHLRRQELLRRSLAQAVVYAGRPAPADAPEPPRSPLRANGAPGPLLAAARDGAAATLASLLSLPEPLFDPNERDAETGRTPLLALLANRFFSAKDEVLSVVFSGLLRIGANPWLCDNKGLSPLRAAAANGCAPFLEAYASSAWARAPWAEPPLAESPAMRHLPSNFEADKLDALSIACASDSAPTVRALLALGADPDARGPGGLFPAHCARSAPVLEALLQAGANPAAVDADGRSVAQAMGELSDPQARAATLETLHKQAAAAQGQEADNAHLALFAALSQKRFATAWRKAREPGLLNRPAPDGRVLIAQAVHDADWRSSLKLSELGADWLIQESGGAHAAAFAIAHEAGLSARNHRRAAPLAKAEAAGLGSVFARAADELGWLLADDAASVPSWAGREFPVIDRLADGLRALAASRGHPTQGFGVDDLATIAPARLAQSTDAVARAFAPKNGEEIGALARSRVLLASGALARAKTEAALLALPADRTPHKLTSIEEFNRWAPELLFFWPTRDASGRIERSAERLYPWAPQLFADYLPYLVAHHHGGSQAAAWLSVAEELAPLRSEAVAASLAGSQMFRNPRILAFWSAKAPALFAAVERAALLSDALGEADVSPSSEALARSPSRAGMRL
jgi:hypothetical protein